MAISKYVRPQLEIHQLLEITRQLTGDHLAAAIVGPTYDLYRPSAGNVSATAYSSTAGAEVSLAVDTYTANRYVLDSDSVTLEAEGLVARVSDSTKLRTTAGTGSGFAVESTVGKDNVRLVPDENDSLVYQIKAIGHKASSTYVRRYLRSNDSSLLMLGLQGRSVQVGDILYVKITDTDHAGNISVKAIEDTGEGNTIAGKLNQYAATITEILPAVESYKPVLSKSGIDTDIAVSGHFTGKENTIYNIVYDHAAGTVTVSDTAGIDTVSTVAKTSLTSSSMTVGTLGVSIAVASGTIAALFTGENQSITVACTPDGYSATNYDRVRLSRLPMSAQAYKAVQDQISTQKEAANIADYNIPDSDFDVLGAGCALAICLGYSGDVPAESASTGKNWEVVTSVDENGDTLGNVKLTGDLYINAHKDDGTVMQAAFITGLGTLTPSYRVLQYPLDEEEDVYTITSTEDIQNAFGTIDVQNTLAYGCQVALDAAAGREIYAIRTQGIDAAAFKAAVKKTEGDSNPYTFAALTYDLEAQKAVADFNEDMSAPDVKKWRRTAVGVEVQGEYVLTSSDVDDTPLKAYVLPRGTYGNVLVQLSEDTNLDLRNIAYNGTTTTLHQGDKVRFNTIGKTCTVASVLSKSELLLEEGLSSAITDSATQISLIKADTPENAAEYVRNYSGNFSARRVTVAWTDNGTKIDSSRGLITIPNMYGACEIAGLSSAVLPQQSITHSEVQFITAVPRMYTQYTQKQLDYIAAGGVLIFTQDAKNGTVYIRHGLTTETDKGNLYYEDMCTRNLDNISYAVADVLEPYIGRANVTPSALLAIKRDISNLLHERMSNSTDEKIGPQLIEFSDLTVKQDETYLDCVNVRVKLYLPLPLNNIRVYEMAYVARVSIETEESEAVTQ